MNEITPRRADVERVSFQGTQNTSRSTTQRARSRRWHYRSIPACSRTMAGEDDEMTSRDCTDGRLL